MDLKLDFLTDGIDNIKDWFQANKDWILIPSIVTFAIIIIGIILLLLTGKYINTLVKTIIIALFLASPAIGYFLGEYIDPYLEPLFSKMLQK